MVSLTTALALWAAGSLSAALAVLVLTRGREARPAAQSAFAAAADHEVAFLFRKGTLIDATPAARQQMPCEPAQTDDLARFVIAFGQRFEGLADSLAGLQVGDRVELDEVPDDPGSLRLVAQQEDGQLRITIVDPLRGTRSETVANYSLAAMRAELFTLRSIAERSPIPTWKRRHDGSVIWANSRYMTLARAVAGDESLIGWPPPDLFAEAAEEAAAEPGEARRVSVTPRDSNAPMWFDLIALPGEIETLYFALPIDKLVRAENALTDFVHTLTKTFADLRVGLAIFDSRRRLVLFNPALVDLTGLPAEQLSSRPSLHAFLDALRDRQRIPEPKDYKSWRMKIAKLEAGAADGTFEETWHLPTGQTFRVTGRPHPDGAVAYLFEDISVEISMTRSYRSEIELSQSVVDSLDIAIAAFGENGYLQLSNAAYRKLWGQPAANRLSETSVEEAAAQWAEHCQPGEALGALRAAVRQRGLGRPWQGEITRRDGTPLRCDVRPVAGGAILVTFAAATGAEDTGGAARPSTLAQVLSL